MSLLTYKEKKHSEVLYSMVDYMNYCNEDQECPTCEYDQTEIDKCGNILDIYIDELIALGSNPNPEKIKDCVKSAILELNNLSEDSNIIETQQREDLCKFIQDAAVEAGLQVPVRMVTKDGRNLFHDITEEWREW